MVFLVGDDVQGNVPEILKEARYAELVDKPMSLRWLVARINDYFGQFDGAIVPAAN